MSEIYKAYYQSEIGTVEIAGSEEGICSVGFVDKKEHDEVPECLKEAYRQLGEYFEGKRETFDLKLSLNGTEFQRKVWHKLMEVPYGKTATYKDIAEAVENPKGVRAVGGANNKNKIAIVVPCHRIVGTNGSLTGFAGGLWRKEWLLRHESRQ